MGEKGKLRGKEWEKIRSIPRKLLLYVSAIGCVVFTTALHMVFRYLLGP